MVVSASLDGTIRRWTLKGLSPGSFLATSDTLLEILDPVSSHVEGKETKPVVDSVNCGITDAELDELLATDEE